MTELNLRSQSRGVRGLFGSAESLPMAFPLPELPVLWREGTVQDRGAAPASLVPGLPTDLPPTG